MNLPADDAHDSAFIDVRCPYCGCKAVEAQPLARVVIRARCRRCAANYERAVLPKEPTPIAQIGADRASNATTR